jgi:hypothetical protein
VKSSYSVEEGGRGGECRGMAKRLMARCVRPAMLFLGVLGLGATQGAEAQVETSGRVGRAIVAALAPHATATYPDKTVHDYPQGRLELREGMALSELHTLNTDEHGRICLVLTPGAMLCVRPSTSVKIDRLEQMTDGLPETGKDLQRRIELTLNGGGILIHAGPPSPNMLIQITTPMGTVTAHGGEFLVVQDKGDWVVASYRDDVSVAAGSGKQEVPEGASIRLVRDPEGRVTMQKEDVGVDSYRNNFDVCQEYFPELDQMVFLPSGVDMERVQGWIGTPGGVMPIGDPLAWSDVTPSMPLSQVPISFRTPSVSGRGDRTGGWQPERIWRWYRDAGVIKGVNYVPRTAVNATEFWQAETVDTNSIDEELNWANQSGFNSVRVPLSYAVWEADSKGFKDRLKKFLDLAHEHHLTVVPVLFDDLNIAGRDPVLGKQADPVPGVHNSQWTPNPGRKAVEDLSTRGRLEKYVRDITGTFYRDKRILFWDLYNMPGSGGMGEKSLSLLESSFRWAREADTRQPITAAVWGDANDPMSARLMALSDLITFQSFENATLVQMRLRACEAYRRPIVCSDWLKRQNGSTFVDVLPVLADKGVGWFSRGLVRGRTQLYLPDHRTEQDGTEPKVWQQDVLWPDGKPYDRREIELVKAFHFSN